MIPLVLIGTASFSLAYCQYFRETVLSPSVTRGKAMNLQAYLNGYRGAAKL
jgi:hypothetical protein